MFLQCNYSDLGTWKKIIIQSQSFFWKQWILKFFLQTANKIQGSTMQPMKALKPFELTWPLWKQPINLWMLLVRLQQKQKTREKNLLWLANLLSSAPVRVVAL